MLNTLQVSYIFKVKIRYLFQIILYHSASYFPILVYYKFLGAYLKNSACFVSAHDTFSQTMCI